MREEVHVVEKVRVKRASDGTAVDVAERSDVHGVRDRLPAALDDDGGVKVHVQNPTPPPEVQPVSAAALPLPGGAATEVTLEAARGLLALVEARTPALETGRVPVRLPPDAHPTLLMLQPNVSTLTDSAAWAAGAPSSVDSGAPDVVAQFTRNKAVGGYTAWTLEGRVNLVVTSAPNRVAINAPVGPGTLPGAADTWTTQSEQAFTLPFTPTSQGPDRRYHLSAAVQVGCDANQNPAGFSATLRIIDQLGNVLVQGAPTVVNPSVGGATLVSVSCSQTTAYNAYQFNGFTPSSPLRVQLTLTSVTGAVVGQLTSFVYQREWQLSRTINHRVRDGDGNSSGYAGAAATSSGGVASTTNLSLRTIAYVAPFTNAATTHYLEAYVSSLAAQTDPDSGLSGSMQYQASGATSLLRLTATVGNPFVVTPADLGFARLFVDRAVIPANAEFRYAHAAVDGVDTADAKGRVTGLPDGLQLSLDGMEVTKLHLSQGAGASDKRPLLIVRGEE